MLVPIGITAVNGSGIFRDYTALSYERAYLLITNKELWASAMEYQTYRQSAAGGSNNAILIDVDELNLQFGGGVYKHIM